MATTTKEFTEFDKAKIKNNVYEGVPITGSIISGTYYDENMKTYGHGMFTKVYDYPYLSSSAVPIYDITLGYSNESDLSSSTSNQNEEKINIYNQFAQVLMGYDSTGSIVEFDQDGNIAAGGTKIREAFFVCFDRSIYKDEIKKGSYTLNLGTDSYTGSTFDTSQLLGDYGAADSYKVNSPAGEYGILYTSSATPNASSGYGLIFYQAGIAVITASVFQDDGDRTGRGNSGFLTYGDMSGSGEDIDDMLTGNTIDNCVYSFNHRVDYHLFSNTTEIFSTAYFVRANHNEFNYSSNPTSLTGSKLVVKERKDDVPTTYITGINLHAPDGEILAVAKVSTPIKKTSESEVSFRVRLDY